MILPTPWRRDAGLRRATPPSDRLHRGWICEHVAVQPRFPIVFRGAPIADASPSGLRARVIRAVTVAVVGQREDERAPISVSEACDYGPRAHRPHPASGRATRDVGSRPETI